MTETKSNIVLRNLLDPERFVVRELTERDYGTDLLIECFQPDRVPNGRHLLIQLKGSDTNSPDGGGPVAFSVPVTQLTKAELFAIPVLMVWVPTASAEQTAWYLWVQEYIEVVLDEEEAHKGWRDQGEKTVHLPADNRLHDDGSLHRLMEIAATPARNRALLRLAGIAYDALWHENDHKRRSELLSEALAIPQLHDPNWGLGNKVATAIQEAQDYLSAGGKEPSMVVSSAFAHMNAAAWQARNADVRHYLWITEGVHLF